MWPTGSTKRPFRCLDVFGMIFEHFSNDFGMGFKHFSNDRQSCLNISQITDNTCEALGGLTPSMVSSLMARDCCRYGRDSFRKGTRQGCKKDIWMFYRIFERRGWTNNFLMFCQCPPGERSWAPSVVWWWKAQVLLAHLSVPEYIYLSKGRNWITERFLE